jgi:peptide/nickel transport system substrate-binding protein
MARVIPHTLESFFPHLWEKGNPHFSETGIPHHASPAHPEFCEMQVPKYNPERARQLLREAGYANGLDIKTAVVAEQTDALRPAEALKEDSATIGFRLTIDAMPGSKYWEQWTEVDLGMTQWAHRLLGTMVLGLGCVGDADGLERGALGGPRVR